LWVPSTLADSTRSFARTPLFVANAVSVVPSQSHARGDSLDSTRRVPLALPVLHATTRSTQHLKPYDLLPPQPSSPPPRSPHSSGSGLVHLSDLGLHCPGPIPSRLLLFVEVLVLVVFRALQGQLKGEAILGDLVDPYSRGNFSPSRVSSPLLARFGGSVRLP